ncbi:MAG TPA: hypothetical protein VI195_06725, partial [Steroidobacteraceae bacterium]
MAVEAAAETQQAALAGVEAAYLAIQCIERRLHPSREGSELQRIRGAPLDTPVRIAGMTWQLLHLAQ